MGRIAIFCNGVPPGTGVPSGAQGLRAYGLLHGLLGCGLNAEIVCSADTIHSQLDRWAHARMRIPGWLRILRNDICAERISQDYETVFLLNWAGLPEFKKKDGQRLIYDFFSPTLVEHSFIADAAALEVRRQAKNVILKQADLFIANGAGRAEYGASYVRDEGILDVPKVHSVRLALPWMGSDHVQGQSLRIFFGGFDQAWTRGLTQDDLARLGRQEGFEVHAIGLGQRLHQGVGSTNSRARGLDTSIGIESYPVAALEEYRELNKECDVALDVFELNEERKLSYSTRAITSLASGCPVVTMAGTEIGTLVEETGAGWVLDEYEPQKVLELLDHLASSPDEVKTARDNTKIFWEAYADPAQEAAVLIEAMS